MPGMLEVELWPTYVQAAEARKRYARAHAPQAFGVRVMALDAWVEELWRVDGDGRALVSSTERDVILSGLLLRAHDWRYSAGMVELLGSIISEMAGLEEYERAKREDGTFELSDSERAVLRLAKSYDACLEEAGLVERGTALALLRGADVSSAVVWNVKLCAFDDLKESDKRFFEWLESAGRAAVSSVDGASAVDGEERAVELRQMRETVFYRSAERTVEARGSVGFLLPTGAYARPELLAETVASIVREALDSGWNCREDGPAVVVSAKEPLDVYDAIVQRLFERGVGAGVQGTRPFRLTSFGRAFLSLARYLHGDDAARTGRMLTDFMESSFSGVSSEDAQKFDSAWRGDRALAHDPSALLASMEATSEWAALMEEAACDGDLLQIKPTLDRLVAMRSDWSDAFKAEQSRAVSLACEFGNVAIRFGVPFKEVLGVLERRPLVLSAASTPFPEVLVCDENRAAQLPEKSAFALFSCDMTSEAYPLQVTQGAKESLRAHLGIPERASVLERSRARFLRVLSVPRDRLLLERPLNDANANELYPSVMFEEVVDCYREDVSSDDDLDRTFGIPTSMLAFMKTRGEENLREAVDRTSGDAASMHRVELGPTGAISDDRRSSIVVSRIDSGPAAGRAVLSATQLESYLECPYKWFALRRLRLETPDMGFGAMEMGVLVHHVMNRFYERLRLEDASGRVTSENVDRACALVEDVFWDCFERQRAGSSSTRVVPCSELEEAQVRELASSLVDYVRGEASFLPGFVPLRCEWEFGTEEPFVYAGHCLRGSVDRIDVDERGRAVVIDYKGGIGTSSDSPYLLVPKRADESEGFVLPGKIQALVYAQVVRRTLGLDVVGALYANYSKGTASGAVDGKVLDPACARMAGPAKKRSCMESAGFGRFGDLLDETEKRIGEALERMMGGDVAANPSCEDACDHCPVMVCDKRKAS